MINLLRSKTGQIIISIILGFGLACLFRKVCKDRNCIIYNAPDMETIKKSIFLFDNKCYKYDKEITKCNKNPVK